MPQLSPLNAGDCLSPIRKVGGQAQSALDDSAVAQPSAGPTRERALGGRGEDTGYEDGGGEWMEGEEKGPLVESEDLSLLLESLNLTP